jgi:hypothetical protein
MVDRASAPGVAPPCNRSRCILFFIGTCFIYGQLLPRGGMIVNIISDII